MSNDIVLLCCVGQKSVKRDLSDEAVIGSQSHSPVLTTPDNKVKDLRYIKIVPILSVFKF